MLGTQFTRSCTRVVTPTILEPRHDEDTPKSRRPDCGHGPHDCRLLEAQPQVGAGVDYLVAYGLAPRAHATWARVLGTVLGTRDVGTTHGIV